MSAEMWNPSRCLLAAGAIAVTLVVPVGCGSNSGTSLPNPEVVSTVPEADAAGVGLGTIVAATFNQQMNLSTVNESTFVLGDPSGALVTGTVAYDVTTFTATFTADAPLAPNTMYTAGISVAVTNIADTTLPEDFTWTFTTGAAP